MKKIFVFFIFFLFLIPNFTGAQNYEGCTKHTWIFGAEKYSLEIHFGEGRIVREGNNLQLFISKSWYSHYQSLPGGFRIASNFTYFQYFVTPEDPYLRELALMLDNISKENGFDNLTEANFILSFVQEVPYVEDYTATGFLDYYKFPLETLMKGGDCEDKSILLYTLLHILGYDAILFVMEVHYFGVQGHVAVGLNIENDKSPFSRFLKDYYTYRNEKYYYMESTGATSEVLGIGGFKTIHYYVGISPEEAGIEIENLTAVPVGNWHYKEYKPPHLLVEEINPPGEDFSWSVLLLTLFTLIFVPLFISACLGEKKHCPRCGYPLEKDYEYCPNCGYWLGYFKSPPLF